MKKLLYYCIVIVTILTGCSLNEDVKLHNDIKEYQGVWRDTISSANAVYIEDLIINDNSIKYTLTDTTTHVILDTLSGTFIIGNENKIGWICYSPISNEIKQYSWNVLNLSTYQMRLYSIIMGQRDYKRAYHSSIKDYNIQDTLLEMFYYKKYLPLHKKDLIVKFGDYNRLTNCNGITYFTHHPLFGKISFTENYDNDSIYSYTLFINDWNQCVHFFESDYKKIRNINATTEYIDSETLETSNNVIIVDSSIKQISFKPINDYDYWPNVSHYLGDNLRTFMDDYQTKYVYRFHKNVDLELDEYSFQTHKDSICAEIFVDADSNNIIKQSGVYLMRTYLSSKKKDAQKELEKFACLLSKKYNLDKEGVDENGNIIYYYHPKRQIDESPYEIRLRLRQYQNGITKLYQVAVNYILL